jgi:hypothetical protein
VAKRVVVLVELAIRARHAKRTVGFARALNWDKKIGTAV